jgi:hypothetical protein
MAYSPGFNDITATISIAANATSSGVCSNTDGGSTYTFQLSGTWVGTVQVQFTRDGTNWVNITGSQMVINAATGAYLSAGNVTANGIYQVDVTGATSVRIITTAYTSGTITGSACLSQADSLVSLDGTPSIIVSSSTPAAASNYTLNSAASTNAVSVKATAGNIYLVVLSNPTATPAYFKLYNKATAPTVGTDVPVITLLSPANSTNIYDFAVLGVRFTLGVAIACTGAITVADTTSSVAGVQITMTYL